MKLMNTACLAALLLTCPLAATAVHGADQDYNSHEVTKIDSETGIVASSDLKEQVPQGTYSTVYFGRAYNHKVTTSVESSNNEGTLGTGLTVTGYQVYGGWVSSSSAATVKANGNKVTLKNGVSLTKGPEIYGGKASGSYNTEANDNTVIIGTYEEGAATQEGFKGAIQNARGGAATSESATSDITSASNNTVKINEGFENSVKMKICVGSSGSMLDNAEGVYKASENKLYITNPAKLTLGDVYIGYIFLKGKAECTANNNYTELQLNENVEFTSLLKSFAQSKGNVEASDNKVYIQGGKLGYTGSKFRLSGGDVQSVAGGENTTAKANGNIVNLTDVEMTPQEFHVGHAVNYSTENENNGTGKCITQANKNTLILNGGTYNGSFYVGCAGASSGTVTANENSIELRKGTDNLSPDLTNASLIVAYSSIYSGGTGTVTSPTGNSLKFYDVKDMHAKAISGFQKLNYEYSEMHVDDVILTVTDSSTSIASTDVNVSVGNLYGENDGEFQIGDKVVLLKNGNGIEGNDFTTSTTITAQTGISLRYEVDILLNDDRTELILNSLALYLTKSRKPSLAKAS